MKSTDERGSPFPSLFQKKWEPLPGEPERQGKRGDKTKGVQRRPLTKGVCGKNKEKKRAWGVPLAREIHPARLNRF